MQNDYTLFLEKSVQDLLQYGKGAVIDRLLQTVFEGILKAEQKGFLGYGYGQNPKAKNKRNGYRKSALLKGLNKMFRVNVPRDRLGIFKPLFLELLTDQTEKITELSSKLYVKGLTTREISDIVYDIYGKNISRTTVTNITNELLLEIDNWLTKPLEEEYYAIYIDALRLPIRRDTVSKECFYIALGLRKDLKREILGVYQLPEENHSSWDGILKDLKKRGLNKTLLFITDELPLIEEAIYANYPDALLQRCIVHKKRNILDKVRNSNKKEIMSDFNNVLCLDNPVDTVKCAVKRLDDFINKWSKIYPSMRRMFVRKEEYFSYIKMPFLMRRMVYTNNWIENLNSKIKRTTKIRNSFPNPKSAEKLVSLKCIELENNYMKYPVTALVAVQDQLNIMLETKLKTNKKSVA